MARGAGEAGAHGDHPALAPLAAAHVQASGRLVEVTPLQRQGLADAQAGVGRQEQQELGVHVGVFKNIGQLVLGIGRALDDARGPVLGDLGVAEGIGLGGAGPAQDA